MDGIDGIAASEETFVAWSGAALTASAASGAADVILGATCLGFLRLLWANGSTRHIAVISTACTSLGKPQQGHLRLIVNAQ